jgi:hypothetical protein
MTKKTRIKLNEALDKALEPPRNRDKSKLDELLNLYEVEEKTTLGLALEATALQSPDQPDPTQNGQSESNPTQPKQVEVSPSRDFTKVPNSITKEAIPQKFFRGLSKHTYDILYRHTRGNVKPVRKIQLTKNVLMKLTGLSFNTIQAHIGYLRESGLLKVEFNIGKHEGSTYEILVPEELRETVRLEQTQSNPTQPNPTQNSIRDTTQYLDILGLGSPVANKDTYEIPKTSLKTMTVHDDDYAFAKFAERMTAASRRLTKKGSKKNEEDKWDELAELLIMELDMAAARTKSISNIPAFLTEHLKRRLLSKSAQSAGKSKIGKALKSERPEEIVEEYQAEPLTERGREAVLKTMSEYIRKGQHEYVMCQEDSYTTDDWKWLRRELERESGGGSIQE